MKRTKRIRKFEKIVVCVLAICFILSIQTDAVPSAEVNQDETIDAVQESNVQDIIEQNTENAGEPDRVKPNHPKTTYKKEVFLNQVKLHGVFSSSEVYFQIPDYWETKYVYAEIEYRVSQLIEGATSSVTFSVNGMPVQSCRVTYENGETQILYVEIPLDLLVDGYNSFEISAYAKLYDAEGCMDTLSDANWLAISNYSSIRSGYEVKEYDYRIAHYPYPFLSTMDETGSGLTIAVSDQATNLEVAAAMNVMADISSGTVGENNIQFVLCSDVEATETDRTILISNFNHLPAEYQEKLGDADGLEKQAAILATEDNNGNPLLLITSKNEECLIEAVYLLMDEERISQEKGISTRVKQGSANAMKLATSDYVEAEEYTLKELMGGGLRFVGPFHQEQVIYLPMTEACFLSSASKVLLNFRYSENLDFTRSLVTVYWGDIPVASKKLEKEKAAGDELIFSMPSDVMGIAASSIRIAFDLEIKDLICTPRQEKMPWAYISEESIFVLPESDDLLLSFDLNPSAFRVNGKFDHLILLISEAPTTTELNLYAQLVALQGNGVKPYGTLEVKRFDEFNQSDAKYHIITAGTYRSNDLFRQLNQDLYFSYSENGNYFESNDRLILSDQFSSEIAILQMLESPYAKNRGILAVTGTDEASLQTVETFLRDEKLRYGLAKDCVIIDTDLETKSYQFLSKNTSGEEPTVIGNLTQNKQSVLFTILATSSMLMLLIAVIIILIRVRMYHKKNDE